MMTPTRRIIPGEESGSPTERYLEERRIPGECVHASMEGVGRGRRAVAGWHDLAVTVGLHIDAVRVNLTASSLRRNARENICRRHTTNSHH